jgi:hypothetical protein
LPPFPTTAAVFVVVVVIVVVATAAPLLLHTKTPISIVHSADILLLPSPLPDLIMVKSKIAIAFNLLLHCPFPHSFATPLRTGSS